MSHADFQLPGLNAVPDGTQNLMLLLAFAYSRRWNRRRLEDPFYGFWNRVLNHLIHGLCPGVFVVPQLTVFDDQTPKNLANISGDTIGQKTDEAKPDFTIMRVQAYNRGTKDALNPNYPTDFTSWHLMQIHLARPRALAELKRPPPRKIETIEEFRFQLEGLMKEAQEQAAEQAELAFAQHTPGMENLVVIAAVGEWYTFRVIKHWELVDAGMILEGLEEETVPYNPRVKMEHDSDDEMEEVAQNDEVPMKRYTDLGAKHVAWEADDVEKAMPLDEHWSDYLLFGSSASNQALYLIHRELSQPL